MTNKPVETLRDGALSASIWKNEGENGQFHSVTFARTYTKDDISQSSDSFSANQLLTLAHLATRAYDLIARHRAKGI